MGGANFVPDVEIFKGGVLVARRYRLNFINGTGINLTIAEDPNNDKVDITVDNTGNAANFTVEHNGDGSHKSLTKVTDPYIDIRDGGAAHNADSGAAINATIAKAVANGISTVLIPDKTFIIETSVIPDTRVRLSGMGPNSLLKAKAGLNAPIISATGKSFLGLSDFAIDGNMANQTTQLARGVSLTNCIRPDIERLYITGCYGHAIWANNCTKPNIFKNDIYDTGIDDPNPPRGIYTYLCSKPLIGMNEIRAANGFGITDQGSTDARIIGNDIDDSVNYDGIIVYDCEGTTVVGNTIKNVKDSGIVFELCEDYSCVANMIRLAGYVGIYMQGSSYGTVQGNRLRDNGQNNHPTYCHDIIFTTSGGSVHSLHNTVEGNILRATAAIKAKYGIQETSANHDYNIIKNNQLVGHTVAGISLLGPNSLAADNK